MMILELAGSFPLVSPLPGLVGGSNLPLWPHARLHFWANRYTTGPSRGDVVKNIPFELRSGRPIEIIVEDDEGKKWAIMVQVE